MKGLLHILSLILLLLLAAQHGFTQNGVSVKAGLGKTKWLIGEQVKLTLEASFPPGEPFSFFVVDSIPHFEFIDKPQIDTVDNGGGVLLRQELVLTSFDSGHWVIPPFFLTGKDSIVTDSLPVDVVFSAFDPQQAYHDIREVMDVTVENKKPWWFWYAIGGGVLLLGLLIWLLTRKKKKPVDIAQQPVIDPFTEAMQQLEKLKTEKMDARQYHSRLTDIFRIYLSKRKGIASTKQVTDELVMQLKELSLQPEIYNRLAQALRLTDFVKFAKYEPAEEDNRFVYETISQSVQLIEKSGT